MDSDTRSFALCVEDFQELKTIKKLHLNVWQLPNDLLIDIGIPTSYEESFF